MSHRVVISLCVIAACGPGGQAAEPYEARDSAGVHIVEYESLPEPAPRQLTMSTQPVLEIGVVEGPEEYMFSGISGVGRLSDGSVLVANGRPMELRVFDTAGALVRRFGARGQGPGEFTSTRLAIGIGDTITVWDANQRRFTVFSPSGMLLDVAPAAQLIPDYANVVAMDGRKTLFMAQSQFRPDPEAFVMDTVTYVLWTPQRPERLDTIVRAGRYDGSRFPLVATLAFAAMNGNSFLMDGAMLGFRRYDDSGSPQTFVRVREPPNPITPDDIAKYADMRARNVRNDENRAASLRRRFMQAPHPVYHAQVDQMRLDSGGRVWLRRATAVDGATDQWIVFAADGEYQSTVAVPNQLFIRGITDGFVLGVWTDELGVQSVRVYALNGS